MEETFRGKNEEICGKKIGKNFAKILEKIFRENNWEKMGKKIEVVRVLKLNITYRFPHFGTFHESASMPARILFGH